jgi:hypothetical protein
MPFGYFNSQHGSFRFLLGQWQLAGLLAFSVLPKLILSPLKTRSQSSHSGRTKYQL